MTHHYEGSVPRLVFSLVINVIYVFLPLEDKTEVFLLSSLKKCHLIEFCQGCKSRPAQHILHSLAFLLPQLTFLPLVGKP